METNLVFDDALGCAFESRAFEIPYKLPPCLISNLIIESITCRIYIIIHLLP
jgi:hypothetical protein